MATDRLTPDRILEATEDVLRRYGPAKATVTDVARALGVSHGSVYRHFRTKQALREAVIQRWLGRTEEVLAGVAEGPGGAGPQKLERWLRTLFAAKRHKAGDDPELFATYSVLLGEDGSQVVEEHLHVLTEQLRRIIEEGIRAGQFAEIHGGTAARAVFDATRRFHDPVFAPAWSHPGIEPEFEGVLALLLRGLRA
ncbi:TetR family transcriptional regulator [Streptomyces sp. LP05-1]|uniref:TetR family transcriptional regulator n=1 Tax=Streptomyces pyxinae TaxID=2970734 RepID=A0ABT2CL86_9ACTN|nr:TetR family transcriptional regulator [Streptomyces sp. LP05-1]MCS0638193.1 TetR family transcriptional regulator [Streptomyces sp. LP05-1]